MIKIFKFWFISIRTNTYYIDVFYIAVLYIFHVITGTLVTGYAIILTTKKIIISVECPKLGGHCTCRDLDYINEGPSNNSVKSTYMLYEV